MPRSATSETSLAAVAPALAAEWDPANSFGPETVLPGSAKRAAWICAACGHRWSTRIAARGYQGQGCPGCAGQVPTSEWNLAIATPEWLRFWDAEANAPLTPERLLPASRTEVAWRCDRCGHRWRKTPNAMGRGPRCDACRWAVATATNNLAAMFPAIAAEWDAERNGVAAAEMPAKAYRVGWWRCAACGYRWQTNVDQRTHYGKGCAACAGQVVVDWNCLATVRPEVVDEWHPTLNGDLTPLTVYAWSITRAWWRCATCGHEWQTMIGARRGCPACVNQAVTEWNCMAATNPALAAEWHPELNGSWTPHDVTAGSRMRAWWLCSVCGHEWQANCSSRNGGAGCLQCFLARTPARTSVPERTLIELVGAALGEELRSGLWFTLDGRRYSPDGVLLSARTVVEYDGSYWHRNRADYDEERRLSFLTRGYRVIRVREEPLQLLHADDIAIAKRGSLTDAAGIVAGMIVARASA